MVLFWHQVFATGQSKIDNWHELINQADMLREKGMGNYRDLLVALAKNPAMIYWLDNCDNHGHAVNENWGRELLELFSLGVGMDGHPNYTETDVREASRAFTGWTIAQAPPRGYYNRWDWEFEYLEEDHDDGEKTFLGHTGNFDGEDIIDIVVQQPSCHRFIARHLYNFFVADEAQVPAWMTTPPRDPEAVDTIARAFADSHYDMRSTLRVLFLSDFFKNARFAKIKVLLRSSSVSCGWPAGSSSPAQGLAISLRIRPTWGRSCSILPAWKGGTRALVDQQRHPDEADQLRCRSLGDVNRPGIRALINRLKGQGDLSPEGFVDSCLDLIGPLQVEPEVRQNLVAHAKERWCPALGHRTRGQHLQCTGWGNAAADRIRQRIPVCLTLDKERRI